MSQNLLQLNYVSIHCGLNLLLIYAYEHFTLLYKNIKLHYGFKNLQIINIKKRFQQQFNIHFVNHLTSSSKVLHVCKFILINISLF